jgi:small subunit ribosomal protein S20
LNSFFIMGINVNDDGIMPYNASPKKRLRRDTKKRLSNKSAMSALRSVMKKANQNLEDVSLIQKAQKALSMAASKGLIHKNTAARRTGRLMKKAVPAA